MLHQDYLVRMFMVLAAAIRRTILNTSGEKDPEASAELLESTLSNATEIDGSLLLKNCEIHCMNHKNAIHNNENYC